MAVNGQLIGSKKTRRDKLDTYFGTISVYYQPEGIRVTVSTTGINVADGRNNHTFAWAASAELTQDG